jgi:hypothetical protein
LDEIRRCLNVGDEFGRKFRVPRVNAEVAADGGDDLADAAGAEGVVHGGVGAARRGVAGSDAARGRAVFGRGWRAAGAGFGEVEFAAQEGGEDDGPADGAGVAQEVGDEGGGIGSGICVEGGGEAADEGHSVFGEAHEPGAWGCGRRCGGGAGYEHKPSMGAIFSGVKDRIPFLVGQSEFPKLADKLPVRFWITI